MEGFEAGSCSQFVLQNNPVKYPDFNIQNIYVNGKVWTGEGTNTRIIHPDTANPDENMCSGVMIPAWHYQHPDPEKLARMTDKSIYPGERLIFTTGMFKGIEDNLGEAVGAIVEPHGHIVIRAFEGGKKFKVFVLDPVLGNSEVKYTTDYLDSK
ncbi:MAG: hypothetical protein LBC47_02265 [Tannerella sp.]|nr:hypothetical protein [Tannerella sp.]